MSKASQYNFPKPSSAQTFVYNRANLRLGGGLRGAYMRGDSAGNGWGGVVEDGDCIAFMNNSHAMPC